MSHRYSHLIPLFMLFGITLSPLACAPPPGDGTYSLPDVENNDENGRDVQNNSSATDNASSPSNSNSATVLNSETPDDNSSTPTPSNHNDCGNLTLCGDTCANTNFDVDHCGQCHNRCGSTQYCVDGTCTDGQSSTDCRQTSCEGMSYCDTFSGECVPGCDDDRQCNADEICDIATHSCIEFVPKISELSIAQACSELTAALQSVESQNPGYVDGYCAMVSAYEGYNYESLSTCESSYQLCMQQAEQILTPTLHDECLTYDDHQSCHATIDEIAKCHERTVSARASYANNTCSAMMQESKVMEFLDAENNAINSSDCAHARQHCPSLIAY